MTERPQRVRSRSRSDRVVAPASTTRARRPANALRRGRTKDPEDGTAASRRATNRNVEPFPGSLSKEIVPPISSASLREIARPSPVPPKRRVVELSPCRNDSKSEAARSGEMPIPVSRTVTTRSTVRSGRDGSLGARADRNGHFAGIGELHRVPDEVHDDLLHAGDVAEERDRNAVVHVERQLEAFLLGALREDVDRPFEARADLERSSLQAHPPRLDLREVEDVVDEAQERLAALPDRVGELALLPRQGRAEEEARHPDDAVHRRPDLVAHRGEERALGPVGVLGLTGRRLQLHGPGRHELLEDLPADGAAGGSGGGGPRPGARAPRRRLRPGTSPSGPASARSSRSSSRRSSRCRPPSSPPPRRRSSPERGSCSSRSAPVPRPPRSGRRPRGGTGNGRRRGRRG